MITSVTNNNIKSWVKLVNNSQYRRKTKSCIIEGETMVREAIKLNLVTTILIKENSKLLNNFNINTEILSEHCFKKISKLNSVEIMAIVNLPRNEIKWQTYSKILVCDRLQNPDNLGSLIRSAHAANFDCIITTPGSADIFNPKTLRASTGSVLRFTCLQMPEKTLFTHLKDNFFTTFGLAANGNYDLFKQKPTGKVALIVGNEGQGLSQTILSAIDYKTSLPINNQVESLNAAIAASIAMYKISWG